MSAESDRKIDPLEGFSERTRRWFESSFEAPTPAQAAGWPTIASGREHADLRAHRARARR